MAKTLRRTPDSKGDKTRNYTAIAAQFRNSAGKMGGSHRAQARRDRQSTKRALRAGAWA